MKLTSAQLQQLHTCMLSAFPTRPALEQFALFQLGENLNVIAGGDTLSELAFSLMRWAAATGRIEEMIHKAQAANPGNEDLLAFMQRINGTAERMRHEAIANTSDPAAGENTKIHNPPDPEAVANQQKLLATYRRSLALLLEQRALHGSASAPLVVLNEITEARKEIQRAKSNLQMWGINVVYDPNDSEYLSGHEHE